MTTYAPEREFALAFASHAADAVRRLLAEGFDTETKADASVVTTVDHVVNQRLIEQVVERFPDDAVLGEEAGRPAPGPRTWVIDPVDGTRQLVLGVPVFMVSLALVVDGRPVVGVAVNPSTGETYWAETGVGAYRDGTRLQVSRRDGTGAPLVVSGGSARTAPAALDTDGLVQLTLGPTPSTTVVRYPFPTVFSGCKVAEGLWDADLYGHTGAHDVAAVCVLVREAGGTVTDRDGRDQRYDVPVNGCVVSNGLVHDHLVTRWAEAVRDA